jgi:hypothetical protein
MDSTHQYAYDIDGKWVKARETEYQEHKTFICACPDKHRMKLVKPSGNLGKRSFSDYFAHVQPTMQKKQKMKEEDPCYATGGGESLIHLSAKHRLREQVGSYCFATSHCTICHNEEIQYTEGCSVYIEIVSEDKRWRYDCLLKKGESNIAALEVVHKHLTGMEKISSVRKSGLEIAEFRAKDVLDMPVGCMTKLENIKMKFEKCQKCAKFLIYSELTSSEKGICVNFNQEIHEIQYQEYIIEQRYAEEFEWKKALEIKDVKEKSKMLLGLSLHRVSIFLPLFRDKTTFNCDSVEYTKNGLLVSGMDFDIPTPKMCIVLVNENEAENLHNIQWKYAGLENEYHIILHQSTILNTLSNGGEKKIVLKDCRWAMLKKIEEIHSFCANCGRKGHRSEVCYSKLCVRCGRKGHLKGVCFARKDVLNQPLD